MAGCLILPLSKGELEGVGAWEFFRLKSAKIICLSPREGSKRFDKIFCSRLVCIYMIQIAKRHMHLLRSLYMVVFGIWFVTPTFAVNPVRI